MKLYNPASGKEYDVNGPTYENELGGVWCGTTKDKTGRTLFVKIQNYGIFPEKETKDAAKEAAMGEAKCLRHASKYTPDVPKLYESWNDKNAGRYILIMEKATGYPLRDWIEKNKKEVLTEQDLFVRTRIILDICEIMAKISRGTNGAIVHRDLKPENIFIRRDQYIKKGRRKTKWKTFIIDFGLANLGSIRNTGTVDYRAPEQTGSKNTSVGITSATDIFAIGQIFYEMLLGRPPQIGTDYTYRYGAKVWTKRPELNASILDLKGGSQLNDIIKRMTEFEPANRIIYDKLIMELQRIQFR